MPFAADIRAGKGLDEACKIKRSLRYGDMTGAILSLTSDLFNWPAAGS
jgi:hypothetical protein